MNEMYNDDPTGGSYGKGALFQPTVSEYAIWYDTRYRGLTCMFSEFIHQRRLLYLFLIAYRFVLIKVIYR